MKKIINALIAIGAAVLLAGCANVIAENNKVNTKPVDVAKELEPNTANENTSVTPFKILSVALEKGITFDNTSDENTCIVVTFNSQVNADSLKGISVKPVKDSKTLETANEVFETGNAIEIKDVVILDKSAYLYVSLKAVDAVEVYADSTIVTAKNGQKLDMDGDKKQGESIEDDYNKYFYASLMSALFSYGKERKLPASNLLSPVYSYGKTDSDLTDVFYVILTSENLDDDDDLSDVVKNIKIQKYNSAEKKWNDLTYEVIQEEVLGVKQQYYGLHFEKQPDGTNLRAVVSNPKALATTKEYNGYKRYFTTDDSINFAVLETETVSCIDYSKYAEDKKFFSAVTPVIEDDKLVSISFTVNTSNSSYDYDYTRTENGQVIGVKNIIENIDVYNSSNMEKLDLGEYTVIHSEKGVYGVNSDKTYYANTTYLFKNPLPNYGFVLYAKPEMEIEFAQNDGTDDLDNVSYKLGINSSGTQNTGYGTKLKEVTGTVKGGRYWKISTTMPYYNQTNGYFCAATVTLNPGETLKWKCDKSIYRYITTSSGDKNPLSYGYNSYSSGSQTCGSSRTTYYVWFAGYYSNSVGTVYNIEIWVE